MIRAGIRRWRRGRRPNALVIGRGHHARTHRPLLRRRKRRPRSIVGSTLPSVDLGVPIQVDSGRISELANERRAVDIPCTRASPEGGIISFSLMLPGG
jgi:hypothetical protein